MLNKHVHAIYDDDDKLLSAVKHLRSSGVSIKDVFTPFPVHGLDHALDLKPTRIAIAAFISVSYTHLTLPTILRV